MALPAGAASRVVTEALNRDFPGNPTAPIEAVVQFPGPVAGARAYIRGRTAQLVARPPSSRCRRLPDPDPGGDHPSLLGAGYPMPLRLSSAVTTA